jgi:hypothetical protein
MVALPFKDAGLARPEETEGKASIFLFIFPKIKIAHIRSVAEQPKKERGYLAPLSRFEAQFVWS